ncbi:MAG: hypothetical protein ACPHO8_11050, partial [Mariniblastus sp.]
GVGRVLFLPVAGRGLVGNLILGCFLLEKLDEGRVIGFLVGLTLGIDLLDDGRCIDGEWLADGRAIAFLDGIARLLLLMCFADPR